jgi:spore germination protein GerM
MHKIPKDIQAYLDKTPALTKETTDELAKANKSLCNDPKFLAGVEKMIEDNAKLIKAIKCKKSKHKKNSTKR